MQEENCRRVESPTGFRPCPAQDRQASAQSGPKFYALYIVLINKMKFRCPCPLMGAEYRNWREESYALPPNACPSSP